MVDSPTKTFTLDIQVRYLCLLGDMGLVKDDGPFQFLERLLHEYQNLVIFYKAVVVAGTSLL